MSQERRKYPRLKKELPLKIATNTADFVAQTKNISCNGAYCTIDALIPLMTKLKVIILLPKNKNKFLNTPVKIQCIGVVVRTKKIPDTNLYNTAIFFEQIREREKGKLQDYINQFV